MRVKSRLLKRQQAFSLTELLTVIAVIGVISAIGIPSITNMNQTTKETVARRNAQQLASVCESAKEAGLFFADPGGDIPTSIANAVTGGLVEGGAFDGTFFGVPGLTVEQQGNVVKYLVISDGTLVYSAPQSIPD